mmetsp:Transcript_9483/g.26662  ORF Transcript_9483/g.26662 Transcript_9483/m.26662 type:complete len:213 (-) Transcript_9483:447-1085(-)
MHASRQRKRAKQPLSPGLAAAGLEGRFCSLLLDVWAGSSAGPDSSKLGTMWSFSDKPLSMWKFGAVRYLRTAEKLCSRLLEGVAAMGAGLVGRPPVSMRKLAASPSRSSLRFASSAFLCRSAALSALRTAISPASSSRPTVAMAFCCESFKSRLLMSMSFFTNFADFPRRSSPSGSSSDLPPQGQGQRKISRRFSGGGRSAHSSNSSTVCTR